jgi:hypothetical protein
VYDGNGKAAYQACDLAEIPAVLHFEEGGELLNAFVVAPQDRPIGFVLSFNLRSRPLMRHNFPHFPK